MVEDLDDRKMESGHFSFVMKFALSGSRRGSIKRWSRIGFLCHDKL